MHDFVSEFYYLPCLRDAVSFLVTLDLVQHWPNRTSSLHDSILCRTDTVLSPVFTAREVSFPVLASSSASSSPTSSVYTHTLALQTRSQSLPSAPSSCPIVKELEALGCLHSWRQLTALHQMEWIWFCPKLQVLMSSLSMSIDGPQSLFFSSFSMLICFSF